MAANDATLVADTPRLYDADTVRGLLGNISKRTLLRLRDEDGFPEPVKIAGNGRRIAWHAGEVLDFIASRPRVSEAA